MKVCTILVIILENSHLNKLQNILVIILKKLLKIINQVRMEGCGRVMLVTLDAEHMGTL